VLGVWPRYGQTVFPKPGGKVWYDDQREVHRQIFDGDETIDYAFMGLDPEAADNRWLREAFENQVPIIYFLGIAPGRYQAMLPTFIAGWDARALKARVAFGVLDRETLEPPENALERRYALPYRTSRSQNEARGNRCWISDEKVSQPNLGPRLLLALFGLADHSDERRLSGKKRK
jgi:hypothetical protein